MLQQKTSELFLKATINSEAEGGDQIEEYNGYWGLTIKAAIEAFAVDGFWSTWDELGGHIAGGVTLYDAVSHEGLLSYFHYTVGLSFPYRLDMIEGFKVSSSELVAILPMLKPDCYLFWVANDKFPTA